MNFKKIREIVKFDLQKSIQNKGFIILNVLIFISCLLFTNWSNISNFLTKHNMNFLEEDEITIQIIDNENLLFDSFSQKYSEKYKVEKLESNPYSRENIPEDNTILVEVSSNEESIISAKIVSKEGISDGIYNLIYNELKEVKSNLFASKYGISVQELNILNEEIPVERELLGVNAENYTTKQLIKSFSVVIVYMVLIVILSRIASEIAQEKVSKSIEYVLTSVTAGEYLISKVLSVTLAVLVQILYTFVYYIIGNCISSLCTMQTSGGEFNFGVSNVDSGIVSYVLVMAGYLIFTVFLTALIQATISSKATSVAEAGNTTMVLLFIIVALYLVSLSAISPYITVTPTMYVISCLPIVSTFFVPSMMIIGQATTAQIVISFLVLIAVIPPLFKFCSKHFKNGILDYTSSKKRKSSKKELSIKEKQERDLKVSEAKKFGFTIGMAIILMIFLEVLLSFVLGLILPKVIYTDSETLNVILNGLVSALSLGITAIYIISNTKNKVEVKEISGKEKFVYIFSGIAIIAILQTVLSWIYPKIGLDYNIFNNLEDYVGTSKTFLSKISYIVLMAIVPAIFEELLFRKAILDYSRKYGNGFAILFSAILFGLFHLNLNQGIFAFLVGILFGIIAVRTSNIKLTVLLHFFNNLYSAMQVILSGFVLEMFNNAVLALVIFAVFILLSNIKNIKNIKKEDFKIDKDFVLIFKNYTFIISTILLIVMFAATESFLR